MNKLTTIGLDTAKHIFHLIGIDERGQEVLRKRLRRTELLEWFSRQPRTVVVGVEACGGAHHWARELRGQGFTVKLLAPCHVKGYVVGNKDDWKDARAIAEAASRAQVPVVAIASVEQQAWQALHRIRSRLLKERTRLINQLHGLLAEFGLVLPKAQRALRTRLAELGAPESTLHPLLRSSVNDALSQWQEKDQYLATLDRQLKQHATHDPLCARLQQIRGIGPLSASALSIKLSTPGVYRHGRHFSANLGIVPRHQGTGGKVILGPISKRGDRYLRSLLIQGARNALQHNARYHDALARWLKQLVARRGKHKAVVALANKNARIAFALAQNPELTYNAAWATVPAMP